MHTGCPRDHYQINNCKGEPNFSNFGLFLANSYCHLVSIFSLLNIEIKESVNFDDDKIPINYKTISTSKD